MNYVELFNGIGRRVKPATFTDIDRLDLEFRNQNLDSLDVVMFCVYACEVFGVAEEVGKALVPSTFQDIVAFVERHGTRRPASAQDALALIDG